MADDELDERAQERVHRAIVDELLRFLFRNRPRKLEDYRHVVKIEDDRALLIEATLAQKQKEINAAEQLLATLQAERDGLHGRLFMRLREVYPTVPADSARVAKHKNDLYYVGVNENE